LITPVWNKGDLTHQHLSGHWYFYQGRPSVTFTIVDNGSTDGTKAILKTWHKVMRERLIIISNKENEGFARACNQGAADTKADILVFVNNDIVVQGDYLRHIESALAKEPDSLTGPAYLDYDTGWNRFRSASGKEIIIPYLAGWCLGLHWLDFVTLGGFDERYSPADYEDLDFCYQASQHGYKLVGLDIPLAHLGGQSGFQLENRREITSRNREKFKEKWGLYEP
jgi:GT2 family glycosyltransferase